MQISYYRANKERDRLYGVPDKDARVDTSTQADKVRAKRRGDFE